MECPVNALDHADKLFDGSFSWAPVGIEVDAVGAEVQVFLRLREYVILAGTGQIGHQEHFVPNDLFGC